MLLRQQYSTHAASSRAKQQQRTPGACSWQTTNPTYTTNYGFIPLQMPPEPKVPTEGVVCLPVTKNIKCLRGVCNERLKYEVEYSLKKGTSENSYLLKVSPLQLLLVNSLQKPHLAPWLE